MSDTTLGPLYNIKYIWILLTNLTSVSFPVSPYLLSWYLLRFSSQDCSTFQTRTIFSCELTINQLSGHFSNDLIGLCRGCCKNNSDGVKSVDSYTV